MDLTLGRPSKMLYVTTILRNKLKNIVIHIKNKRFLGAKLAYNSISCIVSTHY